jgi:hypothetical protein
VDVVRAYVALLRQGRVPGPHNLRLQLSAGSFTTIAKHVNALALRHVALRPPRKRPRRTGRRWMEGGADEYERVERSGYR